MDNTITKKNYVTILKQKDFMLYLIGQLISRFGDSVDYIAYGWMVYELTGSTALMALLFGINAIPNIIFQPIAGVFVNYKKKKNVLIVTNLGRAIMVTITAILFATGTLKVYYLYIFTFINSTFESFNDPASVSSLPLVLDKDLYSHGMAFRSSLSQIVQLIGAASAAGIIAIWGISGGLLVNAFSFYICGAIMFLVKFKGEILKKDKLNLQNYLGDLKEGFSYLKNTKIVFSICIFGSLIGLFLIPLNSLGVAYIAELSLRKETLSLLNFCLTLGMLIGNILSPKLSEKYNKKLVFIISGSIVGICYSALSIIPYFNNIAVKYILMAAIPFLLGFSAGIFILIINVSFMKNVETEYLSRVGGVFNSVAMACTPVGSFVIAGICAFMTTYQLYLLFGILTLLLFISQIWNKHLEKL